ncbi:ASCH domain-containing protein [Paenibacillus sp. 19GGS1-52]|uniref:ASCH domain-containing protein n=1 Tax=Paenibacillus sp. 19GGS1-52 TaxID=2758563 RepID=UPI001EFA5591|nr:ASCH domain-containing protein [Paenibacillus sp. 19GGS1-52]ULO08919.1 ASCH domain-containing protein [Paenibacillus sp. 19GGS1-52]
MKGLVIKQKWADQILSGIKPWEIRSRITHQRGTRGIIKSGSGLVYGTVDLTDCIKLTLKDFEDNRDKHRIPASESSIVHHYKELFAWVVGNPQIFPKPIPYNHPQGAVIWVNLPEDILEGVNL